MTRPTDESPPDSSSIVESSRRRHASRDAADPPWKRRLRRALVFASSAVAVGLLLLLAIGRDSYGIALTYALPLVLGFTLGWAMVIERLSVVFACAGGAIALLAVTFYLADGSGFLCVAMMTAVLLVPTALGVALGRFVKWMLERSGRRAGSSTPFLLFLLVGAAIWVEPGLTPPAEPESVVTRRVLDLSPAEAWERILFYEEVPFEPPLLARLGVPHPLGTEGRIAAVGDIKRCLYTTGYLDKKVTRFAPRSELVFDIVAQRGIEDRSAELLTGSFAFEAIAGGRTEVTLTTTYRPLLQARHVWRPFERVVAHLLHGHVLDGMERAEPEPQPVRMAGRAR